MSLLDKILKSLKNNVPIYLCFLGVGLGFVVYLYYFNLLTLHYLCAVIVTTSNLFGILLVVLLMGYGLINIPRDMWVYSTNSKEIEFCQYRAFELFAESVEAEETDQLRDVNETDLLSKTESLLEDYGNKLFKEYERRLYEIQFKDLSRRWVFLNRIEVSEENTYEIKFHKYYRPIGLKFMSGVLWIISLIIIYSEITMFMGRLNLSIFGRVVNFYDSFFTIYFLCISSLLYLFAACLYGLINLKIKFWRYYIYKNSSSNGVSLLVLSAFISMISFSLCLNFSLMVKLEDTINFSEIVMVIDLLPIFGKKFNMFFPVVLSLTCIFAFFNIYGKILHIFGITSFEFKGTQKALEEGRKILLQIIADHESLETTSHKDSERGMNQ